MSDNARLTRYQVELLQLVAAGNPEPEEGGPIDFDQLLEALSWKPTKASCHFSIRALVKRGLLKKTPELMLRRGRQRVGFELTQEGVTALDPRETPPKRKDITSGVFEELPKLSQHEMEAAVRPLPEVFED